MIITILFTLTVAFIIKLAIDHIRWYYVQQTTEFENDIWIITNYESNLTKYFTEDNDYLDLTEVQNDKETFTIG